MSANKKKDYKSPTTPGLQVNFYDFIVELVCLNMYPKLGPRFWSKSEYWKKKYSREISIGIKRLKETFEKWDFEDKIVKIVLVRSIKNTNIQSLLITKSREKLLRRFVREHKKLIDEYKNNKQKEYQKFNTEKNSRFVDPLTNVGVFGKIRKIEKHGKEESC